MLGSGLAGGATSVLESVLAADSGGTDVAVVSELMDAGEMAVLTAVTDRLPCLDWCEVPHVSGTPHPHDRD